MNISPISFSGLKREEIRGACCGYRGEEVIYPFRDEKISGACAEEKDCVLGYRLPFSKDEFCSMTGKSSGEVGSFTYGDLNKYGTKHVYTIV